MAYFNGRDVAVVGVSPVCCGNQGTRPSRLFMSTDLVHWRDVTPAGSSRSKFPGDHPFFENASFLDPSTGWVTTWDSADVRLRIWRTSDGGRSWSDVAGGGHSANAGATTRVQLVSSQLAVEETLEPTGPGMSVATSVDGGRHWHVVYSGPAPRSEGQLPVGPFEMPIEFVTRSLAIGAAGNPPADPINAGGGGQFVFRSGDGGRSWSRQQPPGIGSPPCPQGDAAKPTSSCTAGLPSVFGRDLLLPVVRQIRTSALISFDVSRDGARTWNRLASLRTATGRQTGSLGGDTAVTYPLVSLSSPRIWWVVSDRAGTVTTKITGDGGGQWRTVKVRLPGRPVDLHAASATQAWLRVDVPVTDGTARELFVTRDGGRSWHRWVPPR